MIHFFKAWIITTTVFLMGDVVWLYCVMNKFFVPQIKHLMNSSSGGVHINYFSAIVAYLLISTALSFFVVVPLQAAPSMQIFIHGAFLGLCIYGVYECTNHATLNDWPVTFLIVDIVWGTVWSGVVSVASVVLFRYWIR